jgi:hypothetical protein
MIKDLHLPGCFVDQTRQDADDRRFAGPVSPEQGAEIPGCDF